MIHDFIVIGAGIAGASAGYELAAHGTVLILEAESQPGYHSSGRSAALFTRNYGGATVRAVNALSEPFFRAPPDGFADGPLLTPRGALTVAAPEHAEALDAVLALSTPDHPVTEMDRAQALERVPYLRPERTARAVHEPGVTDIEVARLLQSYLKGFRRRGGQVATGSPVRALDRAGGTWTATTGKDTHRGAVIVNAAGAWADQVGALAGAAPVGLVAKRRTAILIDAPGGLEVAALPCVDFAGGDAYIKPDAGKLMASPGDATPTPPQDARPEEMDIAVLADWITRETLIPVRRIAHSWAGLRSFVADDGPVLGADDAVPGLMWHAGHGGYGIMMAPALARAVAGLCIDNALPEDFRAAGMDEAHLGRARLRDGKTTG